MLQGEELECLIDETPGMRNLMSNLGYSAPEKMELHLPVEELLPPITNVSRLDAAPEPGTAELRNRIAALERILADRESALAALEERPDRPLSER